MIKDAFQVSSFGSGQVIVRLAEKLQTGRIVHLGQQDIQVKLFSK